MPLDLLGNLINDLGGCVDRVVTDLREDAFLATIPLTVKGERQQWMKVELVAADAPRSHALSWHCAAARRSWSESQTIEAARPMTSLMSAGRQGRLELPQNALGARPYRVRRVGMC